MVEWAAPPRPEARIWLDVFNERLLAWLGSQRQDAGLASELVDALRSLLERAPDSGATVASLATNLLHQHADVLEPRLAAELADIGLTAELVLPQPRPLIQASLTTERGRTSLAAGRFFDAARDGLEALAALDRAADADADLLRFIRAKANLLRGSALDALLDYGAAADAFGAARELTADDEPSEEAIGRLLIATIAFLYGAGVDVPDDAVRAELQLLWRDIASTRAMAAMGAARSASFAFPETLGPTLDDAVTVFQSHGLVGVTPLDLGPVVRRAEPQLASRVAATVSDVAEQVGHERDDYEAVLFGAAACAAGGEDGAEAAERAAQALERADDLLVMAAATGYLFVWESTRADGNLDDARALFFDALDLLHSVRDARLNDPRLRASFDEPVALGLRTFCDGDGDPTDRQARIELARLIDFEIGDSSPLDGWLPPSTSPGAAGADLMLAAGLADDRLGRLQRALRDWPSACALLIRSAGAGLLLACVSADGMEVVEATPDCLDAWAELTSVVSEELEALELTGRPAEEPAFLAAGQAAYAALPEAVRARLADSDVLLVCPDHRTGGDAVPYELFHDGSGWLGTEKIVARFPSLRALVHSAEGTARSDRHRRLLALAVPQPPGYDDPLTFAAEEAEGVREFLDGLGWDAPAIRVERVTPAFVTERLPYATHIHLATHGEAEGAEDALVLADGRLTSTDLAARFFPRMPSAFVNACSLATTRWVGGGTSRGIAQGFLDAGSPAVVANLLPVEDAGSSQLAAAFYREAVATDVGEALRRARSTARETSSPVLWGSTVLIGDPRTTLVPGDGAQSLSQRLLDLLFGGGSEDDEEVHRAATEALLSDPADVRLTAAAALAREVAAWGATPGPGMRARMAAACRVAVDLDHLPAASLIAFALVDTYGEEDDRDEAMRVLEGTIELIEPLEHEGEPWKPLLDRLLARWMLLRAGSRTPAITISGPGSPDEHDELRGMGEALRDAQLAVEARNVRRNRAAGPRDERTGEDVLWNAVFANRTLQLESMPEIAAFGTQVAEKLAGRGELTDESLPHARVAISGLLKWLWDSQNVFALPPEMAEGQTGTLAALLRSIATSWPPQPAPWFEDVRAFPGLIAEQLAGLEGLPYNDQLYPAIDAAMGRIEAGARACLDSVAARDPDRTPDAMAWILGTLIDANTFSWVDGSVPESKEERLRRIHNGIAADAEAAFYPWLVAGFERVRDAEPDELELWRLGLDSGGTSDESRPADS